MLTEYCEMSFNIETIRFKIVVLREGTPSRWGNQFTVRAYQSKQTGLREIQNLAVHQHAGTLNMDEYIDTLYKVMVQLKEITETNPYF